MPKKTSDACDVIYVNKDGKLNKKETCFLCGMPKGDHDVKDKD